MTKKKIAETSAEAWKSITKEQIGNHHAKILAALAELKSASSEQISTHTTLAYWQVTRRMSELEKKGLIYNTRNKVATRTGRSAFTYSLSDPNKVPEPVVEKVMPGKSIAEYSRGITRAGYVQKDLF